MKKKKDRIDRAGAAASSYIVKLVQMGRCTKVTKGGRRFRFVSTVVAGDKKGRFGIGSGKGAEPTEARAAAERAAKKKMRKVSMREGRTLHHDITAKFCSGRVVMRSAPPGTGIIAGGGLRALFEVAGFKDIVVKSTGSSNHHNMLGSASRALSHNYSPRHIAAKRGKKIYEILGLPPQDLHAAGASESDKTTRDAAQ